MLCRGGKLNNVRSCSGNLNEENLARENWNRRNNKQRKSNSYLVPRNKRSLPILKNGSRFTELKSTVLKNKQD